MITEETIRMQCEAREDYYNRQRYLQTQLERMEQLAQEKKFLTQSNLEKDKLLAAKDEEIARLKAELVLKKVHSQP